MFGPVTADALPLLRQAARVTLGAIAAEEDLGIARAQLADVAHWLGRHGVAAEQVASPSIGDDVPMRVIAQTSSLLASRLRERIKPMSVSRAVVHIDHHKAQVLRLDAEQVQAQRIKAHEHFTRQHGSEVRTEHEFFADVCDALSGITDILVVGPHIAQADFRHYVDKHCVALAKQIVGWQAVDHPTEGQLLALARKYFIEQDGMARTQTRM